MNKYRKLFIILIVISAFSFGCNKADSDKTETLNDSQQVSDENDITSESDSLVISEVVNSDSEVLEILASDDFPGMLIIIPEGAFVENSSIEISYSPVGDLDLGENYTILTPLIHIEIEEERLDKPIELKIPINKPENHFALAFYYDSETGFLEAIPSVYEDDGTMRIMTTHFSQILVASIMEDLLIGPIETDFKVLRDNLQIPNIRTYYAKKGICMAMAEATLYYHNALRPSFGTLYNLYDNKTISTPGFWNDDRDLFYLNSIIQEDLELNPDGINSWLTSVWDRPSIDNFYMTSFAMLRSKKPQLIVITESNRWDADYFPIAHALIAYRAESNRIYVADPNEPTNSNLYLEIDLKSGDLKPYTGAQSASDAEVLYKYMYFIGDSALMSYDSLTDSWEYLHDGTIADKFIPGYTFYEIIYDSEGNVVPVEITSNHMTSEDTFRIVIEPDNFQASFTAYGDDFSILGNVNNDKILEISLNDEETIIGLQVDILLNDNAELNSKAWTDFKWITVKKITPEKWESVSTISKIHPSSGLTQEQIDQAIGVSRKEILYFSWNPGLDVYQVYSPSNKVNRTMPREGNIVWSDFSETVENITVTDSFEGIINEEKNRIIGKSKLSSNEDGVIYEFDIVMTKIED